MLSVPMRISCMRTGANLVRICFCANFQNHALSWRITRIPSRRASTTPCGPTTTSASESSYKESQDLSQETHPSTSGFTRPRPSSTSAVRPACPLRAIQIADRETFIQIAEAFHIPFAPVDPTTFRRWVPFSEWDMVRILSRGTSSQRTILRRELPPEMLLLDVVLSANLFPLQHKVQRRGAILEALFRISEGYYFGPHHLIMAALLHFEEKVHTRHLTRADSIPLLFPRLLCHVLAHLFLLLRHFKPSTAKTVRRHHRCPTCSSYIEPPITIPGPEYRALLTSFQTLTTTQTAIMERMDHFQTQQDQQTLILREIQQHLGLVPPAPPVAVPSTDAAEDPSYPPEEPTT
ncbi:hypothetical protein AAG906_032624 [Vitis piasezkii]